MFDSDFWQEVLQTIKKQKWRSLMTAFGVFWGLFMLMILIGAGMGFKGGLVGQLEQMPSNSMAYICNLTSIPYMGLERDRAWNMDEGDIAAIQSQFPGAMKDAICLMYVPDKNSIQTIVSEEGNDEAAVAGVSAAYSMLSPQKIVAGRYINGFDINERRKVCVVGEDLAKKLFASVANSVGREVRIGDVSYQIIGITKKTNALVNLGPNESNSVFLPVTTAQQVYNQSGKTDCLFLVFDDKFPSEEYTEQVAKVIRSRHQIHPDDDIALSTIDLKSQLNQFDVMLSGINALVWLVGLGTLLAGLIGISNIMMVTVKERTQEIGVRRALGAEPMTIIKQIVCESMMLTLAAGIVGITAGLWVLTAINKATAASLGDGGFFSNPHVPFVAAIAALFILVMGGLFAGWLPAKRALAIKAIEALREE
jgi:putative ABC transport system permease protein